jgi:hypothetical protein
MSNYIYTDKGMIFKSCSETLHAAQCKKISGAFVGDKGEGILKSLTRVPKLCICLVRTPPGVRQYLLMVKELFGGITTKTNLSK